MIQINAANELVNQPVWLDGGLQEVTPNQPAVSQQNWNNQAGIYTT